MGTLSASKLPDGQSQQEATWGLLMSMFAGANLIQSVFTGFCPPTLVLRKLNWVDENDVIHWGGRK